MCAYPAADAVREDALLPTGIDWPALLAMAWRQGVSALVLDGLERLPESQRPPKPLLLQWIGRVAMMEQLYAKHEQCIASLADFYACHGIRMLLLKGVGCSWCWPRPQHRPVGDVDVYLFGQKEEADQLVEQDLGMAVHREYHKHSTFSYHGVEVENHAKFIDDVSHKSNISFEKDADGCACSRNVYGKSDTSCMLTSTHLWRIVSVASHRRAFCLE